ncbi:VOC family protein [Amycolatopsis sp. CA-128772]|uniref:VOC family protein n=1 Tax=Amycolatopsis sp. CA-128772 TaxID=2073159 RepID=UPI000CD2B6C4|nr:VOC family protein [Amycolatopsis sp. CA-128772]
MPGFNDVAWFEIGTTDPAAAERFYGEVFGWTVAQDESASTDSAYRVINTGGSRGGLSTGAENYAVFTVLVEDVEAACSRAEAAGGTVLRPPAVNPVGVAFAHLRDPAGNHFSVFTPPR